ncbi:MAG: hypothetical protein P8Y63_07890 [Deltaproteobacteria bacterium]
MSRAQNTKSPKNFRVLKSSSSWLQIQKVGDAPFDSRYYGHGPAVGKLPSFEEM